MAMYGLCPVCGEQYLSDHDALPTDQLYCTACQAIWPAWSREFAPNRPRRLMPVLPRFQNGVAEAVIDPRRGLPHQRRLQRWLTAAVCTRFSFRFEHDGEHTIAGLRHGKYLYLKRLPHGLGIYSELFVDDSPQCWEVVRWTGLFLAVLFEQPALGWYQRLTAVSEYSRAADTAVAALIADGCAIHERSHQFSDDVLGWQTESVAVTAQHPRPILL